MQVSQVHQRACSQALGVVKPNLSAKAVAFMAHSSPAESSAGELAAERTAGG
ncbi:hypothetical protein BAUCODRAFT_245491 [Baudoinia panamericana UAMH 10762]|uniref:Uncharacterized protein n=1 Tax=Baudoinia panamericana (strain UAMH 10762) TaxID=717646 RepID=M2MQ26_BAUPA|nr:uncharacterized protein BAUCODRAFT_245491 [Baudoinia panamericana UAMH 10762]EMC93558.1 hypothetical protein BAUCODRAFT_245491 [Baudoinia panamericana UAMH 10762]